MGSIGALQNRPVPAGSCVATAGAVTAVTPFAWLGAFPKWSPARIASLTGADETSVVQGLFSLMPKDQHRELCIDTDLLPLRRLFEPRWEIQLPSGASRVQKLSALATEINIRLTLPNDFLFKVDTASMKESLEVRVPMLDEELFEFGISLPHEINVKGRVCKRVLREVAKHWLPAAVTTKPKQGFGLPLDMWVDPEFRRRLGDATLGPGSLLPEFFRPEFYRPRIEAFCEGRSYQGAPRDFMYQLAIMLLAVQLTLSASRVSIPGPTRKAPL